MDSALKSQQQRQQPEDDGNKRYRQMCSEIRSDIFAISGNVTVIRKLISDFGTNRDTHEMRERINNLQTSTQDLIRSTTQHFKALTQLTAESTSPTLIPLDVSSSTGAGSTGNIKMQKLEQQKLKRDFQQIVDTFQQLQRQSMEKSREYVAKARTKTHQLESHGGNDGDKDSDNEESAGLLKQEQKRQQELLRLDNEIEFNENIIIEREMAIREIETSVHEVNEIFRDLGSLVTEQQGMIDNIESNIENTAMRTGDAHIELQSANRHQAKAKNRLCWILGIFAGVIVFLVLLILMTKKF